MRVNIPSMIIGTILGVYLIVIFPMYQTAIYTQVRSQEQALAYTRNLVDQVIDTKVLTEDMLSDYYLHLGSSSSSLTATISREIRVVNPDPLNPGKTYTSYLATEDISKYNQGDLIIVNVSQVGTSLMEKMSATFMNLRVGKISFTIPGRVR